jgi:leukotriene-A4 hydrolase
MENPRLTFVTPTIIAGDRSLTSLVAHELAHSWSGNLVTNATWDDFWLNEGFTVYFERRIMEEVYGRNYSEMLALIGMQDLQNTVEDLGPDNQDTRLKLELTGRDPDEGMTDVAYEKGYLLLRTMEAQIGRNEFDQFLNKYFEQHQFQSVTSSYFMNYSKDELPALKRSGVDLQSWIFNPGIPEGADLPESDRFESVESDLKEFVRIGRLDVSQTRGWSTHEWLHFIRNLPTDLHYSFYEKLDEVYQFSLSGNSEILAAWLEHSIESGYFEDHNLDELKNFLTRIGRRKFLIPLYGALKETGHLELAREIYEDAKPNYHAVSIGSLDELLYADPV